MIKFTGYFKNAWGDLRQDRRWWQPLLILTIVGFIPIFGPLILMGYAYDWAKEASWGLRRPFTREVGDLAKRLKYGWFGFVISLVWVLPVAIVIGIFSAIPFIGPFLNAIGSILIIIVSVIAVGAILRSLTYERIAPGLQIGRVLKMARKEPGGLFRCWLIEFVGGLIIGILASIVIAPVFVGLVISGVGAGSEMIGGSNWNSFGNEFGYDYGMIPYGHMDYSGLLSFLGTLLVASPLLLVFLFFLAFLNTTVTVLATRAYGYWLGQFMPSRWGRAEDPMPFEVQDGANPYGTPNTGQQAYGAAGGWQQPVNPGDDTQPGTAAQPGAAAGSGSTANGGPVPAGETASSADRVGQGVWAAGASEPGLAGAAAQAQNSTAAGQPGVSQAQGEGEATSQEEPVIPNAKEEWEREFAQAQAEAADDSDDDGPEPPKATGWRSATAGGI